MIVLYNKPSFSNFWLQQIEVETRLSQVCTIFMAENKSNIYTSSADSQMLILILKAIMNLA